jgi:hypothetical protein
VLLGIAITSSLDRHHPPESERVGRSPRFNEVLIFKLDSAADYSNLRD